MKVEIVEKIEDGRIRNAVLKALSDYGYKLKYIPSSMSGRFHPRDERGKEGLLRHIEKVAWLVYQISLQLNYPALLKDALIGAAYFHDLGKVAETKVVQEVSYKGKKISREVRVMREIKKKDFHPLASANLARKYLEKEGLDEETISVIEDLIKSHMSHWLPYLPQPETEAEKVLAIADFIASREEFQLQKGRKKSILRRIFPWRK